MYIIENFAYGLDLNAIPNPEDKKFLIEYFGEMPIEISIKKEVFKIYTFYHGSCSQDYYPGVFGFNITDNDNNPHFITEIRSASEVYWKRLWDLVKDQFINNISEDISDLVNERDITAEEGAKIITYITMTTPCFYGYQTSS